MADFMKRASQKLLLLKKCQNVQNLGFSGKRDVFFEKILEKFQEH